MSIIHKIYTKFANNSISSFSKVPDVQEWKRFIDRLSDDGDCVDIAYNRYQCRQYFFSLKKRIVLDMVGLFFMIIEIPFLLFSNKRRRRKKTATVLLEKHRDVPIEDIVPGCIINDPNTLIIDNFDTKVGIMSSDSRGYVIRCILRYPFRFFFHYFVCKELIAHDFFINHYSPSKVVVYVNERNVASPIIKEIYESEGRAFVSFMHGEYLLNLIQGYMSFSEYYIWDEAYISNFKDFLKCRIDKYTVYTPQKLQKKWDLESIIPKYKYTYYLSGEENKESIILVAKILNDFQNRGYNCKVRPHPRFMDNLEILKAYANTITIEEPYKVSLKESLANTETAIGLNTTVLFEAEVEGRKIVIDDISNPANFGNLRDRRYRLLAHDYTLLSKIIAL